MARIVGYARVSTLDQATNSHALEQQKERLVHAGAKEIFEDKESGQKSDRENYLKLIELIKDRLVDEVVVTRSDRIARSVIDLRHFADLCVANSVNLRILDQQIDLSTPHGKLMLNMLGSIAEWEVDMLKSRITHGLKHHRNEKRAPGIIPFGYIRKDERYAPNHEQYKNTDKTVWQVAREIVEVFMDVQTIRGTARIMGERYGARANRKGGAGFNDFPRENGLRYWILSPVLRGHVAYYNRTRDKAAEIVTNQHEPLITPAEDLIIERAFALLSKGTRKLSEPLPLASLIYCGKCGSKARAFRYKRKTGLLVYWWCQGVYSAPSTCLKVPSVNNKVAEETVIQKLTERAMAIAEWGDSYESQTSLSPEINQLELSLIELEKLPSNPIINDAKAKLIEEIANLRKRAGQEIVIQSRLKEDLVEACSDSNFWNEIRCASKRRFFRRLVDRVIIDNGRVVEVRLRI